MKNTSSRGTKAPLFLCALLLTLTCTEFLPATVFPVIGTVKDSSTNMPLQNALLTYVVDGDTSRFVTDENGSFGGDVTPIEDQQLFTPSNYDMSVTPTAVEQGGTVTAKISAPRAVNPRVSVYNRLGQDVTDIVSSLPSGIYFVSAHVGGKRYAQKIFSSGGFRLQEQVAVSSATLHAVRKGQGVDETVFAEVTVEKDGYETLETTQWLESDETNVFDYYLDDALYNVTFTPRDLLTEGEQTITTPSRLVVDNLSDDAYDIDTVITGPVTFRLPPDSVDVNLTGDGYYERMLIVRDASQVYDYSTLNLEQRDRVDQEAVVAVERDVSFDVYKVPKTYFVITDDDFGGGFTGTYGLMDYLLRGSDGRLVAPFTFVVDTSEEYTDGDVIPSAEIADVVDILDNEVSRLEGLPPYTRQFTDNIVDYFHVDNFFGVYWKNPQPANGVGLDKENGYITDGAAKLTTNGLSSRGVKIAEIVSMIGINKEPWGISDGVFMVDPETGGVTDFVIDAFKTLYNFDPLTYWESNGTGPDD